MVLAGLAVLWVTSIIVAVRLGRTRHRAGLLYGLFLSWLGVALLALLPARPAPEDPRGSAWDETTGPDPDDAYFKSLQYYSRH